MSELQGNVEQYTCLLEAVKSTDLCFDIAYLPSLYNPS